MTRTLDESATAPTTTLPPSAPEPPPDGRARRLWRFLTDERLWGHFLFWTWNLIFVAFTLAGFAPLALPSVVAGVAAGLIPPIYVVCGFVIASVPAASLVLGLLRLRDQPKKLLALGYGVEGPLLLAIGFRFFFVREATPTVSLLLGLIAIGLATHLWLLLAPDGARRPLVAAARLVGLTALLGVGVFVAVWVAFYAPPVAGYTARTVFQFVTNLPDMLAGLWRMLVSAPDPRVLAGAATMLPFFILAPLLAVYSATLLVGLPIALPVVAIRAWRHGLDGARRAGLGLAGGLLLSAAALAVAGGLLVASDRQPQGSAFALLADPPASPTEAESLATREEDIREGLLNAYLGPFRYLSASGEVEHVAAMYRDALGVPPDAAKGIQAAYEAVISPLLYRPAGSPLASPVQMERGRVVPARPVALRDDPIAAARLYQAWFDEPIATAELPAILAAARSTWSSDRAEAAWQAVDDREVHLESQEATVLAEYGDSAEIEIHEVYRNRTGQRQEVVYYFSLPESAVVTGLWLGTSADRATRLAGVVAPRGAAQQVYRQEVRRQVDPALLEQIGPRQYRLRAFPVEPKRQRWEGPGVSWVEEAPELHLWLTYRTFADGDSWPLPRLAERRNVYWDRDSLRTVAGPSRADDDPAWLPDSLPVAKPVTPTAHRIEVPGVGTVVVRPASEVATAPLPAPRLAVVVDRSRSLDGRNAEVAAAVDELKRHADPAGSDVYLTASAFRGESPTREALAGFDPRTLTFRGGQSPAELLAQYAALAGDRDYDAVVVVTDGQGYELGEPTAEAGAAIVAGAPLWLVHLGDALPVGYDDATLAAIQASGGGVAGGIAEALARIDLARAGAARSSDTSVLAGGRDLVDGYVWSVEPAGAATEVPTDEGFAPLAARRAILATTRREAATLGRVETLDQLHTLATEAGIVTPYSSLLVLVDDRQRAALAEASAAADRFDREHEAIGETTPPSPLDVTGVPEPEEWLLIGLGVLILVWRYRSGRPARRDAAA